MIHKAPAVGNFGKRRESLTQEDTENAEDGDGGLTKPLRRGRSSNTETELAEATELAAEVESVNKKKRGRPAQRVEKENGTATKPVRRGRPLNTKAELKADSEAATENYGAPQEKGGRSVQRREEVVETIAKPLQRVRSSNTEAELVAAREEEPHKDAVHDKRRGRSVAADAEKDEFGNQSDDAANGSKRERGRRAVSRERDEHINEAVESPNPSKKRGRPAAAQVEEPRNRELLTGGQADDGKRRKRRPISRVDQQNPGPPENDEIAEAVNSLRRGQSSNAQDELQAIAETATKPQVDAKKRGRRPKADDEADAAIGDPPAEDNKVTKPPRRGRSSNTEADLRTAVESSAPERNVQRKRRKAANTDGEPPAVIAEPAKAVVNKKRTRQSDTETVAPVSTTATEDKDRPKRRVRKLDAEMGGLAASGSVTKGEVGPTARGRRSGTVVEIEAATSSLARDRNVRKKGDNPSKAGNVKARRGSSTVQEPSKSKRRAYLSPTGIENRSESQGKRSKPPADATSNRKHKEVEGMLVLLSVYFDLRLTSNIELNQEPPESKRRRVERESQQEPAPQTQKPPTYQHLAAVTRQVSRQTIEAKWGPLPPGCINLISQLLQDLQRPVVVVLNDERKRTEANKVMQMVSRRLISKISKGLPFPPGRRNHREDDFDFEKILDHNRALESQLTPALHANELLESELAKGKVFLESEEAALAELEINAKTEAAVRKGAGRKVHSLLLSNDSKVEKDGMNENIGLGEDYSILPFTHAVSSRSLQPLGNANTFLGGRGSSKHYKGAQ